MSGLVWERETPYHVARCKRPKGTYQIESFEMRNGVRYFELSGSFIWPRRKFIHFYEAVEAAQSDWDNRCVDNIMTVSINTD